MPSSAAPPLGVVLAGGQSRRFGRPKALAEIGGRTIIERVAAALARVTPEVVLVANEPELFAGLALPSRPDRVPDAGPLAGIEVALRWARERDRVGALCVACDMPFVSPALLRCLLREASTSGSLAVAPDAGTPPRPQPLCAFYSTALLPRVEAHLRRGERRATALLDGDGAVRIPVSRVRELGDPEVLLLNVNTPADFDRATQIARQTTDDAFG